MTDIASILDTVICGDCLKVMKDMPENCIDSIITDPPYGLGFMGKDWDTFKPEHIDEAMARDKRPHTQIASQRRSSTAGLYDHSRNREFQAWFTVWAEECLRVAKPGAILMAFGGTRTYHRLVCAIEDAGWEIRDCIQWIYGSGFPKSLRIAHQFERTLCERKEGSDGRDDWFYKNDGKKMRREIPFRHPEANVWAEHGTAFKPSWEPIIVAMKPLDGTFAENAEKWGVAGLWIDGGRIGTTEKIKVHHYDGDHSFDKGRGFMEEQDTGKGRFPANTILDEEAAVLLDEQSGESKSSGGLTKGVGSGDGRVYSIEGQRLGANAGGLGDSGGASRFFYCAKSSRAERNAGCEGMESRLSKTMGERGPDTTGSSHNTTGQSPVLRQNHHPTVKPLALMEYLCKLTKTPTGGIVLDPFAGSGTTGIAAYKTNRQYILIEKEPDYCKIAEKRIKEEHDKYALFESKGGE